METAGRIAIGALAKLTGTNVETIRYYERVRLLPEPVRSAGGYRLYDEAHRKRLAFIRRARALGFSVNKVRSVLRVADERKGPCADIRVIAKAHLEEVQARLAELRRIEKLLRHILAHCVPGEGSTCPVTRMLSPATSAHNRRSDRRRD